MVIHNLDPDKEERLTEKDLEALNSLHATRPMTYEEWEDSVSLGQSELQDSIRNLDDVGLYKTVTEDTGLKKYVRDI